jgi:hypothetical protein
MNMSRDQSAATLEGEPSEAVKLENEERDELAPDSPREGHNGAKEANSEAITEGSTSPSSQNPSQARPASTSVSHQQLQQILLQQSQLQRNRPGAGVQENGSAASTMHTVATTQSCCAICGAANVPLWRREPAGKAICNSCGE